MSFLEGHFLVDQELDMLVPFGGLPFQEPSCIVDVMQVHRVVRLIQGEHIFTVEKEVILEKVWVNVMRP